MLLKQTADSSDRGLALHFGDKKALVDLGDFRSVVHQHSDDAELRIDLDWVQAEALAVNDPKGHGEPVVQEPLQRLRGHAQAFAPEELRVAVHEVLRENRDLFRSLAQGRHHDLDDVQAGAGA